MIYSMKSYQQTPLVGPGRMIRILALHPAKSHSAALSGTLKQSSLYSTDDPPNQVSCDYEALSYVWGAPSTSHTIQISSSALPITANCDTALRSLRRQSEDRLLWVDSICIDQTPEGTSERNQQVAMMGEIYNTARDVCIWLGEGDFKTDALFAHLRALYHMRDDSYSDDRHKLCIDFINRWGWYPPMKTLMTVADIDIDAQCETDNGRAVQDIIEALISHTWYERMWTLQELLLARTATVLCGKQTMPWDTFCESLELIEAGFGTTSRGMRNLISCFYAYSDFKELEDSVDPSNHDPSNHEESPRIESIMQYTRIRHATYPRDKIIALYGISQRLRGPILKPDYTKSISEVYTSNTASILQTGNSLWPLDQTWSSRRREDLPSWVPDWSEDPRWSHDLLIELGDGPPDPSDREVINHWEETDDTATPEFEISSDHKQLSIRGYEVGVVVAAWDDSKRASVRRDLMNANKNSVAYALALRCHGAEQVKFFRKIYSDLRMMEQSEAYLDTFSKLLLTFRPTQHEASFQSGSRALDRLFLLTEPSKISDFNRSKILSLAQEKLASYKSEHQRNHAVMAFVASDIDAALDVLLSFHFGPSPSAEHSVRFLPGDPFLQIHKLLLAALGLWGLVRGLSTSRSIFITGSGFIGYAYGQVRPGDVLVKFYGSLGPHVLRPDDAHFRLQSLATTKRLGSSPRTLEQDHVRTFIIV